MSFKNQFGKGSLARLAIYSIGFGLFAGLVGVALLALDVTQILKNESTTTLLNDFQHYKVEKYGHHAGDVYEHSIWTAATVAQWWAEKSEWVQGIDNKYQALTIMAGLLHDIGKAGDLKFLFTTKKYHPYYGFEFLLGYRTYYLVDNPLEKYDLVGYLTKLGVY